MSDWPTVRLDSVASEVTVGHVGPMVDEYRRTGVPFLRSQNVRPHRIDLDDVKFIGESFHAQLKKSALRPGDVVTVRTGKPGQTAVIPQCIPVANCSDLVITRPGPGLDSRWLSYYMNWVIHSHISGHLVGAVQQHFNVKSAKGLELVLPSVHEQRGIAEVLGALDDKIAANVALVTTANQLAAHLTQAAMSGRTQALMEIAEITMGASPPGASYNESGEGVVFYQGVRDFGVRFPRNRVWTTEPGRQAQLDDTLVSVRAPVGRTNLAMEQTCIGRGLAAVRSASGRPFSLFHILRDSPDAWAPFEAEGTVFGSINKQQLADFQVGVVDETQRDRLECNLMALEARIAAAIHESAHLSEMRDVLLPLLMSGKIRVKDAERVVEGVV